MSQSMTNTMASQLYCNVCEKSLNSNEQYLDHLKGQSHFSKQRKLEEQNKTGSNDATSSFFIKSSDYPDDVTSVKASPVQSIPSSASLTAAFNDLNIPCSMKDLETNRENEFIFNESTKTGWCYICNTNLSSKQTAIDHLNSPRHQKKKKNMNEVLPSLGLAPSADQDAAAFSNVSQESEKNPTSPPRKESAQSFNAIVAPCDLCNVTFTCDIDRNKHLDGQKHQKELRKKEMQRELERQYQVNDEVDQTKKKGFTELRRQTYDSEQTYRKGTLSADNGMDSQNQTQVKASPRERPTAVVQPQNISLPTSRSTDQSDVSAFENNPDVVIPSAAYQGTRNADEYCEVCHITLTSPEHAAEHKSGRQHRKKADRQRSQPHDDDSKKVTVSLKLKVEL